MEPLYYICFLLAMFAMTGAFERKYEDVAGYQRFDGNCKAGFLDEGVETSLEDCANICDQDVENCHGFSHDGDLACYLKSIGDCSEIIRDSDFIFYSKIDTVLTTPTSRKDYPELKMFTRLSGDCVATGTAARNAYLIRTVLDLGSCAQECLRRSLCAGFTFHQTNLDCLLQVATCSTPQPNGLKVFYEKLQTGEPKAPTFPASSAVRTKLDTSIAYRLSTERATTRPITWPSSGPPITMTMSRSTKPAATITTRRSYLPLIVKTESFPPSTKGRTSGFEENTGEPSPIVTTLSPVEANFYPAVPNFGMLRGSCIDDGTICPQPLPVNVTKCAENCLFAGTFCTGFTYDFISSRCHLQNFTCTAEAADETIGVRSYTKYQQDEEQDRPMPPSICTVTVPAPNSSLELVPNAMKGTRNNSAISLMASSPLKTLIFTVLLPHITFV